MSHLAPPIASAQVGADDSSLNQRPRSRRSSQVYYSPKKLEDVDPTQKWRSSRASNSSYSNAYPHSIEVSEELKTTIYEMRWCFVSLVFNTGVIILTYYLSIGVEVPFPVSVATSIGVIVLELLLLIANFITNIALDNGAAAYLGSLYASRQGYSLAACGFMQAITFVDKAVFASKLSLNSSCRKLLARASNLWTILNLILIIVPISASAAHAEPFSIQSGTFPCLIFNEEGSPYERQWPNVEIEKGVAEVIFGTSLGIPRSEFPRHSTLALISPQIVGAVQDGDTLIGPGYRVEISTTCSCAPTSDVVGLRKVNVPNALVTPLLNAISPYKQSVAMANYVTDMSKNETEFEIYSIISGTLVCGGMNLTNPQIPVCKTVFQNYTNADIMVTFMTDGTPASIAPKVAEIVSEGGGSANMTWAQQAMMAIQGGQVGAYSLPSTVPGVINPILYWTTPNLISIDPTLLDAGIETTMAIFLRGGAQRVYNVEGISCNRNVQVEGFSLIQMKEFGVIATYVIAVIHLALSILAICCFIPWLTSTYPLGPAVRMCRDKAYFTTLVHSSTIFNSETLGNAYPHVIWQALDIVVRVGEPFRSRDQDVVGHITIDTPKHVAALTNGRRYN